MNPYAWAGTWRRSLSSRRSPLDTCWPHAVRGCPRRRVACFAAELGQLPPVGAPAAGRDLRRVGARALRARHPPFLAASIARLPPARYVTWPPAALAICGESSETLLVVSLSDESRDGVGIVKRWAAYEKVRQSGWPDSNRRLLRPKRSTLTRLSYTPSFKRSYSVIVCADKRALDTERAGRAPDSWLPMPSRSSGR